MDELWSVYHRDIPDYLLRLAMQPAMQRLQKVGMNCGCEYTDFPLFRRLRHDTRYSHSMGTALIVWHFTREEKQAAAGLLHDIATPVFAHVVDFLKGDYLQQEATEEGTEAIVCTLQPVLSELGLLIEDVSDYHLYPIADNPAPRLSADRLEYTMSNLLNYGLASAEELKSWYETLRVGTDEQGKCELVFAEPEAAHLFAHGALRCSRVYVSPQDRYAMQRLAMLLKEAIKRGVLQEKQLNTTEAEVIACLQQDAFCKEEWKAFCACRTMLCRAEKPEEDGWLQVPAKKRYINPLIAGLGRVTEVFPDYRKELDDFLKQEQAQWLKGY